MSSEVKITTEVIEKNFAEVVVNGRSLGKREINGGPSVLHLATELAREHGVNSFTVTYTPPTKGGQPSKPFVPQTVEEAKRPVEHGSVVAVQARDSRAHEGATEGEAQGEPTSPEEAKANEAIADANAAEPPAAEAGEPNAAAEPSGEEGTKA